MTAPAIGVTSPEASWLHRMSPIPKVAWLVAGSAVVLVTYDVRVLALIAGVGLACAASAGLTVRLVRTLAGFAPLGASILLVQLVLPTHCASSCDVLATLGPMDIDADAMARGLSLLARLLALEVVAFTIVLATRAPDVIAALDRLRVPRQVSFVVALTLQLVPVLRHELAIVLDAQRARGLRAGGPTALTRAVIPVIVASVERIERLAMSLEARGFGGPAPRTSWRAVSFDAGDRIVTLAGIVAGVAGVVAGLAWWGPSASSVAVSPTVAVVIALGAVAVFVAMLLQAAVAVMRV